MGFFPMLHAQPLFFVGCFVRCSVAVHDNMGFSRVRFLFSRLLCGCFVCCCRVLGHFVPDRGIRRFVQKRYPSDQNPISAWFVLGFVLWLRRFPQTNIVHDEVWRDRLWLLRCNSESTGSEPIWFTLVKFPLNQWPKEITRSMFGSQLGVPTG